MAAECCGNKLTPYLPSKNPSFGNLQLEFRNFIFPGRSLKHLFPVVTQTFSGSKPLFPDPETHLFPGLGNFCFSAGNFFSPELVCFPRRPPKPATPRVSKHFFIHLKTNLLNLSLKHADRIHILCHRNDRFWMILVGSTCTHGQFSMGKC